MRSAPQSTASPPAYITLGEWQTINLFQQLLANSLDSE